MANSKFLLKCLPTGSLPYEDSSLATKMILKLFEHSPYLAMLPNVSAQDNIVNATLSHMPCVGLKEKKYFLTSNIEKFKQISLYLDSIYNEPTAEKLELFKVETSFLHKYLQILERIKPTETVVNLLGPFSMSQTLNHKSGTQILADKMFRKFIIQALSAKALWLISEIKAVSPDTTPIIILEEPLLHRIGEVKRANEEITKDVIVNMFAKVIQKIKECHGLVGIQCFEKCDWQIPIEAGADIISFDAYNNPNNLNIIAEKLALERSTPFNRSDFFEDYVGMCDYQLERAIPTGSKIITSDGVFEKVLDIRRINDGIDSKRSDLIRDYIAENSPGAAPNLFQGWDEYERWKRVSDMRNKNRSQSRFLKENLMRNIQERSNGESALSYFVDSIQENALYLLDEPENSLSPQNQLQLKYFIEDSVRNYGCQFVISTHSPFLLSLKGAHIYNIDETPPAEQKWTELACVKVYHDFFVEQDDKFQ